MWLREEADIKLSVLIGKRKKIDTRIFWIDLEEK